MQQNLDSGSVLSMASMAERGDQLNLIEKRTGNLVNAAETFQKGTKDLGQKEKFSNDKLWLVIVIWVPFAIVIALMLVLIIIAGNALASSPALYCLVKSSSFHNTN